MDDITNVTPTETGLKDALSIKQQLIDDQKAEIVSLYQEIAIKDVKINDLEKKLAKMVAATEAQTISTPSALSSDEILKEDELDKALMATV